MAEAMLRDEAIGKAKDGIETLMVKLAEKAITLRQKVEKEMRK